MNFEETFLQSQNQDCLEQMLSFLTCSDLASIARTSKLMQHTVYEADNEEANVNLIWEGAEEALTNPGDMQPIFKPGVSKRVGSNAREHCHLFHIASKAAESYELSDDIEENRIKVDGVLAELMNVRGFEADKVAEKKAIGENDTQTIEEASYDLDTPKINFQAASDEDTTSDEMKRSAREKRESQRKEYWEKVGKLTPPTKIYHHDIFVRITSVATGDVISQGFCTKSQTLPWHAGLEMSHEYRGTPGFSQGFQVYLDFESLKQSGEMQKFLRAFSAGEDMWSAMGEQGFGINMTAVVIDRRNHNIQCLFQQDQTKAMRLRRMGPGSGAFRYFRRFDFPVQPRCGAPILFNWGRLSQTICTILATLYPSLSPKLRMMIT